MKRKNTTRQGRFETLRRIAAAWVVSMMALALISCSPEGKNEVSRRLLRPIEVQISGRVTDAESLEPIAGIQLGVESAPTGTTTFTKLSDPKTMSDAEGAFAFSLALDIEKFAYLLSAEDPQGAYAPDYGTELYAFQDAKLELTEIRLAPMVEGLRGTITGQVYAAIGGTFGVPPLGGAQVRLLDVDEEEPLSDWVKSDERGQFTLEGAPFKEARLEIRRPEAASSSTPYQLLERTTRRLDLERRVSKRAATGTASLDIGRYYLPASHRLTNSGALTDDLLTIVLSWNPDGAAECGAPPGATVRDLDAALFLPGADCDVNHLGGHELLLSGGAALDPAGMGRGTCFWPPFLGGADISTIGRDLPASSGLEQRVMITNSRPFQLLVDDPRRVDLASSSSSASSVADLDCPDLSLLAARQCGEPLAPMPPKGDCGLAVLAHSSSDGREPEIMTVSRNRFTRDWPKNLGYYYELEVTEDGEWSRRYPMAVGVFAVLDHNEALTRSRPLVEVYDRSELVGRYAFNRLDAATKSDRWTPFVIEIGSKRPTVESKQDIYFRVVSYDQVTINTRNAPYFYQDVSIRRSTVDGGTGVAAMSNGLALLNSTERGLMVLGQTQVAGKARPALFTLDNDLGWTVSPLEAQGSTGTLAQKNQTLLVAINEELFDFPDALKSATAPLEPFCGGPILDIASDPEDPSDSFIVATQAGLRHYVGPRQKGDSTVPASCDAFESGLENPSPLRPVQHLIWIPESRFYLGAEAGTIYPLRFNFGVPPRVNWPNPRSVITMPNGAQVLSLLRLGDDRVGDLFVGTTRGLYVFRGGPLASSAYRVESCADAQEQDSSRPSPSDVAINTLVAHGRRLILGTDSGVVVSTAAEGAANSTICLRWLPTSDPLGSGAVARDALFPPLPPGLSVTGVASVDNRLYVLSRNQGLFFADWSGE